MLENFMYIRFGWIITVEWVFTEECLKKLEISRSGFAVEIVWPKPWIILDNFEKRKSWNIYQALFLALFWILQNWEKFRKLNFWPIYLSFLEFELSLFGAYLVNLSKNRGKLGFPSKISEFFRENLIFLPEFFSKCPQKEPAYT